MSKPTPTRTEPATVADLEGQNTGGAAPPIYPSPGLMPPPNAEPNADALETLAFLAVLQNPRFEQLARLTSADPAVQGAELHAYTRRLVAGYRAAQQEARP